jgi:hypothetical protein
LHPDGGIVGATRVYEASERAFGKRPHYKPLWHVGRFVVTRPEVERYQETHEDRVDLDSGFDDIRAASYDPKYDRIAVCAGDSLYLYSGTPGDDDIVCLGYGALEAPCDAAYIADDTTLLLRLVEGFFAVARFRWIH